MAKIAATPDRDGAPPQAHPLARGDGWSVSDVVCTLGPKSRPFEERHSSMSIAIVMAGTFQYRSHAGREVMTPGSLLLGSARQTFECGHEHGAGDRCISFAYTPEFCDRLGVGSSFRAMRMPRIRPLSPIIAAATAAFAAGAPAAWEQIAIELAVRTAQLDRGIYNHPADALPGAVARVSRVVRAIECDPDAAHDLTTMALQARLSLYHFLRTFRAVTGVTPHQYLLRLRLQRAAVKLVSESSKVLDVALESGFGDVSNFNRAFRAEFGVNPRAWRRGTRIGR